MYASWILITAPWTLIGIAETFDWQRRAIIHDQVFRNAALKLGFLWHNRDWRFQSIPLLICIILHGASLGCSSFFVNYIAVDPPRQPITFRISLRVRYGVEDRNSPANHLFECSRKIYPILNSEEWQGSVFSYIFRYVYMNGATIECWQTHSFLTETFRMNLTDCVKGLVP